MSTNHQKRVDSALLHMAALTLQHALRQMLPSRVPAAKKWLQCSQREPSEPWRSRANKKHVLSHFVRALFHTFDRSFVAVGKVSGSGRFPGIHAFDDVANANEWIKKSHQKVYRRVKGCWNSRGTYDVLGYPLGSDGRMMLPACVGVASAKHYWRRRRRCRGCSWSCRFSENLRRYYN